MKRICSIMVTIVVIATIAYLINKTPLITVEKSEDFSTYAAEFKNDLVTQLNSEEVVVTVAGSTVDEYYNFYVDDNMKLMCEVGFLKSFLSCSVLEYVDGTVLVMKGDNKLELHLDTNVAVLNDSEEIELISNVYKDEDTGVIFVPINNVSEHLSYEVEYNFESNWIDLVRLEGEKILPDAYDMRDYGRVTEVRDQGRYGTCWAFASLGALETSLLPTESAIFSTSAETFIASVESFLRNFRLAGTLKKRFSTTTVVPSEAPTSLISIILPPSDVSIYPISASLVFVIIVTSETELIAASASPRKPSVIILFRSSLSEILLVA